MDTKTKYKPKKFLQNRPLGLDILNPKYNKEAKRNGFEYGSPSLTPKEPRLGLLPWAWASTLEPNMLRLPCPSLSPTYSGLGVRPEPNMFRSRQRVSTHFSPLMGPCQIFTRDFSRIICKFLSILY